MRTRTIQRWVLAALLALLLVESSCGGQRSEEEAAAVGTRTMAVSTPVPCELGRLPSTDPNKSTVGLCAQQTPPPAPAAVIAAQQAYLAEWQKQAASWAGLSDAQKEEKRRLLKEAFLGTPGGQP